MRAWLRAYATKHPCHGFRHSMSSSRPPWCLPVWKPTCRSPTATVGAWPPTEHGSHACSRRRFSLRRKRIDQAPGDRACRYAVLHRNVRILDEDVKSDVCNRGSSLCEGRMARATSNASLTTGIGPQRSSQRRPGMLCAAGTTSPGGPLHQRKSASTATDSKSVRTQYRGLASITHRAGDFLMDSQSYPSNPSSRLSGI